MKGGFKVTPAEWAELGEGVYATCVEPGTEKAKANRAAQEIGKAKRFAHDYDKRKDRGWKKHGPKSIPVLLVLRVVMEKIDIREGSDPEGDGFVASEWKKKGCQACYTTHTDGARKPHVGTKAAEICFKPTVQIQDMEVVYLNKEGRCPFEAVGMDCKYKEEGFKCPCEK
jgi:hypothetical protein